MPPYHFFFSWDQFCAQLADELLDTQFSTSRPSFDVLSSIKCSIQPLMRRPRLVLSNGNNRLFTGPFSPAAWAECWEASMLIYKVLSSQRPRTHSTSWHFYSAFWHDWILFLGEINISSFCCAEVVNQALFLCVPLIKSEPSTAAARRVQYSPDVHHVCPGGTGSAGQAVSSVYA